ncbi:MAG: trypsin-like serine peptidase [Rudaea sp.]
MTSCRGRAVIAAMLIGAVPVAWAQAPITSVPPADYHARPAAKAAQKLLLAPGTGVARVALPAPTSAELASLRARNAVSVRGAKTHSLKGPVALAFPRDVPASAQAIDLRALRWVALGDGSRAATLDVVSPGASALRVALRLPTLDPGIEVRFAGNGEHAQVFGPIPANVIAGDAARFGVFWSPVLDGDVAHVEIHVESGVAVPGVALTVARVSHQVVAPASIGKMSAKAVEDIGTSGGCNVDVACVTPQSQALVDARKAVAAIEFTQEDGFTYLCTGQLLNDSISSNTPYFFSASHCLDSARAARTLNTYWFFDAVACGSKAVPPYVQQASGATLLARSADWDWALVRLNAPPPAGVKFSAWRAEPMPNRTSVSVLHHPEGDLKKWTEGATLGYQLYTDGSSFAQVQYDQGTTEPGSSGAGLLTYFNAGGYYEVRGGLWSGEASCQDPAGIDQYSRLDNMLPLTRQYLTPDTAEPQGLAVAVEYYDRALDHYFLTISPAEINDLDSGVHAGWERTGLRFMAYRSPAPGTNPVCRFYRTPGYGDSHFYSASPPECQAVIDHPEQYPGWSFESPDVFYLALPDQASGACPGGTEPVWRFFNQRTTNHRYTTDHTIRDQMRDDPATWVPEGYGPDDVIMCAPLGN